MIDLEVNGKVIMTTDDSGIDTITKEGVHNLTANMTDEEKEEFLKTLKEFNATIND